MPVFSLVFIIELDKKNINNDTPFFLSCFYINNTRNTTTNNQAQQNGFGFG
jgi:hypothetical protein